MLSEGFLNWEVLSLKAVCYDLEHLFSNIKHLVFCDLNRFNILLVIFFIIWFLPLNIAMIIWWNIALIHYMASIISISHILKLFLFIILVEVSSFLFFMRSSKRLELRMLLPYVLVHPHSICFT